MLANGTNRWRKVQLAKESVINCTVPFLLK